MRPLRTDSLFAQALARRPAVRAAWLAQTCRHDPALAAGVTALLRAHEAATDFMPFPLAEFDPLRPGARIGAYTLGRRIGEGGHGVVHLARRDGSTSGPVAIKLIRPGLDLPEARAQLEAESTLLARLDAPTVTRWLDAGRGPNSAPYLVMEYVRGRRLTAHCEHARLAVRERVELFTRVCAAVAHCHDRGVVHCDLKPSNIIVTADHSSATGGSPRLIDFGLAQFASSLERAPDSSGPAVPRSGTLAYMSPEQAGSVDHAVGPASDVYALGVVLHRLVTGRLPGVLAGAPLSPGRAAAEFYGALNGIVRRCLERDPRRRFTTAHDLAAALRRSLEESVEAVTTVATALKPGQPALRPPAAARFPARNAHLPRETPAVAA